MEIKYTKEQAKMLGLNCKIPSVVVDTWDMESNEKKVLYILSVMSTKYIQEQNRYILNPKKICVRTAENKKLEMTVSEQPLWAVPSREGYNFLLAEEINPPENLEDGNMGELVIVEMMKTYLKAEERRNILLSS